ncbi:MAG: F0F1 ATP synthase subunit alpha, partial [Anaerolineaceae bacterium]|nr:F0F1 ATP synthase subunit alpha [Anaerolineaceae bacterium]
VGGSAQTKAMKQVAGRLRLDMASFRDLAAFAQFGSDLDKATQAQLNRGLRLQELLKQPQYQPMALENQIMLIYAGTNGYCDEIAVEKIRQWESEFLRYVDTTYPEIGREIAEKKRLTTDIEEKLKNAIKLFNSGWAG